MCQLKLNDISDDLLIMNKVTIDTLFSLDNCGDCIALYVFYYKTAKWQKTNIIKATDEYVRKSLKWGIDRIINTKNTLKEQGLINIIQRRENGKISGWYIEVSYIVNEKSLKDISIKVIDSKNYQKQELLKTTSGSQNTNALKYNIKSLKTKDEMLKNNNKEKENLIKEKDTTKSVEEDIFNYWNSNNIKVHIKLTDNMRKAINKALTVYDVDTIKTCIQRYSTIYHTKNYFWHYQWGLDIFLTRKNGISDFLDDGEKWLNYLNKKATNKKERSKNAMANVFMELENEQIN